MNPLYSTCHKFLLFNRAFLFFRIRQREEEEQATRLAELEQEEEKHAPSATQNRCAAIVMISSSVNYSTVETWVLFLLTARPRLSATTLAMERSI